jgi:hypothetical protein
MSSRETAPSLNAEHQRGDKAQEGNGSTVDEILLRSGTDFRKTQSPEGAADGSDGSLLAERNFRETPRGSRQVTSLEEFFGRGTP